jgi:hypothetical protein
VPLNNGVADRVEQMRLSKAGVPVNKQGVEGVILVIRMFSAAAWANLLELPPQSVQKYIRRRGSAPRSPRL